MKGKIICVLLIVALLAVACGPAATTAPTSAPATNTTAPAGSTSAPAATSTAAATAAPTKAPLTKVSIAVGSASSLVYLPYDVAKALKYYQDEGLDVDLQYMSGGTQAATALLSGSVQFSGNSLDHAIKAQPQGKDLKMVVSFTRYPGIAVMVRSDLKDKIKDIKDFKGMKIGVTSVGAGTHVLAQTLAVKAGLKPDDITIVPAGSNTMAAAFEAKQIDVGFNSDPFATQLIQSGRVVLLADLRTEADTTKYLGGEFQFTGALVSSDLIKSKPDLVQKLVNALVRAELFVRTHTAEELAQAVSEDVTGKDKQAWIDALKATRPSLSLDGKVNQKGVENAVDAHRIFGTIGPSDKIDIAALFDNSFVDKALKNVR